MRGYLTVAVFLILALGACQTTYKPRDSFGGFEEQQIGKDSFVVSASGNAYTAMETVKIYALRRSAELTIQNGYTHFSIVDGNEETSTSVITDPGRYSSTTYGSAYGYGGTAYGSATTYGTYTPGYSTTYHKPRTSITIKMFNNPEAGTPRLHDAADVLRYTANVVSK